MKEDKSKENPGLHLLYVKWGIKHLAVIEECIMKLENLSNGNMLNIIIAMQREKDKLIRDNKAYSDAMEILESIRDIDFYRPEKD